MSEGMQTFAIVFRLNRQRSKDGKPAIYLRLTVDYKRIELATQPYVTPNLWTEQKLLADYMSEISERCYTASWMTNLEYVLWNTLSSGPRKYGQAFITGLFSSIKGIG